jgi:Transglycosylase SLT domain/Putative peptidoglycan binding domain
MRRGGALLVMLPVLLQPGNAAAAGRPVYPQVAGLQVALASQRFYAGSIDGVPGAATVSALRSLQRHAGIPVTGKVSPATRVALGRLGRPFFGERMIRRRMIGWDVAVLQFLLAVRGFDVGTLDGHFGARTGDALVAYQRRTLLEPDGIAGPATQARLCPTDGCRSLRLRSSGARIEAAWPAEHIPPAVVRSTVERFAVRAGIAPRLALAVAWVESGYQANVRSATGDWGPMQVSPPAWDFVEGVILGRAVRHSARGNIRVGILYLRHMLREFTGDERLALAAYHQGPTSVRKYGVLPATALYVEAVRGA